MKQTFKLAVLITCHNRREKTLSCLNSLFGASVPEGYCFQVFLVDDGSTDGTGEAVRIQYPQVNVIRGNGNLYWNQGMRLAWDMASKHSDYDFYLWLNDDTLLTGFALDELWQCFQEAVEIEDKPAIITGACRSTAESDEFSYGGRTDSYPVIPNGKLQSCKYINGNVVLVPRAIYENLGNLSPEYTHAMGDFDYGLLAIQAQFKCYTTRKYIAICPRNERIPAWYNSKTPLIKRWQLLNSPKGLNLKEYNNFRKKFWGWKWIIYAIKAYLKVLLPRFYLRISKRIIDN